MTLMGSRVLRCPEGVLQLPSAHLIAYRQKESIIGELPRGAVAEIGTQLRLEAYNGGAGARLNWRQIRDCTHLPHFACSDSSRIAFSRVLTRRIWRA